jgi:hypothetical protein
MILSVVHIVSLGPVSHLHKSQIEYRAKILMLMLWVLTLRTHMNGCQRFGGTYLLHLQTP